MALDIGLGGGGRPVPTTNKPTLQPRPIPSNYIDPTLAGDVEYVPAISTGRPQQVIFVADETLPQYSSVARVVQAYRDRATTGLTYYQAHQILMSQFGFSENDATDALGVEMEETIAYQDLTPPIVAPIEEPQDSPVSEPIYEMGPQVGGVTMVRIVGIAVLYYALAALNRKW